MVSGTWEVVIEIIGWAYFAAWSISFYPQVITNWRRKSVEGFSLDYLVYNIQGFTCYSVFNVVLFTSPLIQQQYKEIHDTNRIPTTWSDIAFAVHGLVLCLVMGVQSFIYYNPKDPNQKVSRVTWIVTAVIWTGLSAVGIAVAAGGLLAYWLIQAFGYVKMGITMVKYVPQVYLNFKRSSTEGWSFVNIMLDLTGGVLSFLQMFLVSFLDEEWSQFTGDLPKLGLSLVSILFDLIFCVQECLYRPRQKDFEQYIPVQDSDDDSRRSSRSKLV